jgi:hypothetical protein
MTEEELDKDKPKEAANPPIGEQKESATGAPKQPPAAPPKPSIGGQTHQPAEPPQAPQNPAPGDGKPPAPPPKRSAPEAAVKREIIKYDIPLLSGADPERVRRMLQSELDGIEKAIEALKVRNALVDLRVIEALLCSELQTEFPGDRRYDDKQSTFESRRSDASFVVEKNGVYKVKRFMFDNYGPGAIQLLSDAREIVLAALFNLRAMRITGVSIPHGGNLHPLRYAQEISQHANSAFPGLIGRGLS